MNAYRTPHKLDRLVIEPSWKQGTFDSHGVDCPCPFHHDGAFWMSYVGFDGIGYQTGLARSEDLLNWEKQGCVFARGPAGSVTAYNAAMTGILRDNALFGPGHARKVGGRFIGTYHAYPDPGYEAGPAVIGLCYSDDLLRWEAGPPVLRPEPSCPWEAGGLYKSWILESGGRYYLFYNAKNIPAPGEWWIEQTGFAVSDDLEHWKRFTGNPVLQVGPRGAFDDVFASDPAVFSHGDTWVMFYFGNCSDRHARDSVAFSKDLHRWEKSGEVLIDVGPEGSIDSRYAHKPGMISKEGRLYHFYCAVAPMGDGRRGDVETEEVRGISVAMGDPVDS